MKRQRFPKANRISRILIAEPFELARIGLSSIILAASRFAVCAATADFDEALELVQRHRPELVVADPFVKCRDGIVWTKDFVGRFHKICPHSRAFLLHIPEYLQHALSSLLLGV